MQHYDYEAGSENGLEDYGLGCDEGDWRNLEEFRFALNTAWIDVGGDMEEREDDEEATY